MPNEPTSTISKIQEIYEPENLILRDPANRRSFINRTAYMQLQRPATDPKQRHSVGNLRERFEKKEEEEEFQTKFTPQDFGYPKTTQFKPPILRPKPKLKDVNSNSIEIPLVLQSASEESLDKIEKELSDFEIMEKVKDKRRPGSFRRFLLGNLFKDKKKKEKPVENNDNIRNETVVPKSMMVCEKFDAERRRQLEEEYARNNIDHFNSIRQQFDENKVDNYVILEKPKVELGTTKYIDSSSSDSPPRPQTYQNLTPLKKPDDTYGTVYDKKPPLSPLKLKLPPNREIYEPQPRLKSPIPSTRVSTEKIIATELLKNSTLPTSRRTIATKPKGDKIVTDALVHQTPVRSTTPIDVRKSVTLKLSPVTNKDDVRRNVEEFYWKQLKKMKEEEDLRLLNGLRRSRSLSPTQYRNRRASSLPREKNVEYVRVTPQPIPEDQAMTVTDGRHFVYNNFVRNNPERRSVDSLQKPIFRRGSLSKQEIYESSPYNKRVSFSSPNWPTRNGYVQSPPQRRLNSELDDDVFVNNENIYGNQIPYNQEAIYNNRVLEQWRNQQYYNQMGNRRLSMDSLPYQQEIYIPRQRPLPKLPPNELYARRFSNNSNHNVYSSRQSIADSNYGPKQVSMSTKYCDIYGQIHDVAPTSTGVVMGRLQQTSPPRQNFVRGTRFTASANDIPRRAVPKYLENRPLPPPPRPSQISDTESGSDVSEIRRIMSKPKKKGFFGK